MVLLIFNIQSSICISLHQLLVFSIIHPSHFTNYFDIVFFYRVFKNLDSLSIKFYIKYFTTIP